MDSAKPNTPSWLSRAVTKRTVVGAISLLATLVQVTFVCAEQPVEPPPSLYQRLGGVYGIATIVDDLVDRLHANEVLGANPAVATAREHEPKAGIKYLLTSFFCWASGGPEAYTGRSMTDAHAHLNITENEWQAMLADFKTTLDKFEIPVLEQKDLLAIVERTKADIVAKAGTESR
jgi:hemoglobin